MRKQMSKGASPNEPNKQLPRKYLRIALTLSPPIPLRLYTLTYWSNPATIINFWHSGTLALRTERQSARMSKINNSGLDQYGAEAFEYQQFGTAGVKGVKAENRTNRMYTSLWLAYESMEYNGLRLFP